MKYKKNKWLFITYILLILISPFIVSAAVEDNFDRTDSTTLGTATNGNTWTETSTEWEIKDNTLYTAGGVNTAMLELSSSNPTRIDYQIYVESTDKLYQRFGDNSGTGVANYAILLSLNSGIMQYYAGAWTNFPTTFTPSLNTLYNISLRNIDYTANTYNLYVDNVNKGSASFTTGTKGITHADFDRRDDTGYIDCLTTGGDTCTGSSAVLDVNITSIKANNVAFVNNTEFTTNDILFNVTYDVINSPSGNFTNSSITNINNALNGDYNVVFEVCYNATCDTSGNYSYSVNVTTSINFDTINVTLDPSNVTGNYNNLGDISTPTYINQDNFFINFNVTLENVSTNGDVDATITIGSASSQFITNELTGDIDWQVPIGDDTYSISFFAENNETNKTTPTYQFIVDTTDPVINNNIPSIIYSYELTGIDINVTDLNQDTCYIQIDSINVTCASFTSRTFTTNGYKNYNITAIDLAGHTTNNNGSLLVSPKFYVYFTNTSSNITDFDISGTTYTNYFHGDIYQYGLGSHSFLFSKSGYEELNFTLTFNTTSNINVSYTLGAPYINIFIRELNNGSLVSANNFTLLYSDGTTSATYDIINNNTLSIINIYGSSTSATLNLVDSNGTIITNKVLVPPRQDVNISFYIATGETLYTKTIEVFTSGLVVVPFSTVYLYANLRDTNEFVLLQQKETSEIGKVNFDVVPAEYVYTICNINNGVQKCLNQVIFDTVITDYQLIHVSTLSSITRNIFEYISWSKDETKTNTSSQMTFFYEDRQSNVDNFCLNVSRFTNGIELNLGGTCSANLAGSIIDTFTLGDNQYLEYTFSYKINDSYYTLNKFISRYEGQAEQDFKETGLLDLIFIILIFGSIGALLSFKKLELYIISFLGILLLLSLIQAYFNESYVEIAVWGILSTKWVFFYFVRAD